jgi:hypothetical protein
MAEVHIHATCTLTQLDVSEQLHVPTTLSRRKEAVIPIMFEAGWAEGLEWTF